MQLMLKVYSSARKHVVPYMIKAGGGSIVNIASVYGLIGKGDVPSYYASKGAVIAMIEERVEH